MKMIRQILLVISGCIIIHLAFRFEHYDTFLDAFLLILLIPIASILFIVTLIKEIAAFRKTKRFQDLTYTFIFLTLVLIAAIKTFQVQQNLSKPSLLKAQYEDIHLDFKKDSTYVIHLSSLGSSSFYYGKFKLKNNRITIDKVAIENINPTNNLEIRGKEPKHVDGNDTDTYIYQIDENGNAMVHETVFKVVVDNRKPSPKQKSSN